MSGPELFFVSHRSGRGWIDIESRNQDGELSRLGLVMEDPHWGYELTGYGQSFYPRRRDGKDKLFITVRDKDGSEGYVAMFASPSEINEIIKEFCRHFRNKARRERARQRREVEAKKTEIAK